MGTGWLAMDFPSGAVARRRCVVVISSRALSASSNTTISLLSTITKAALILPVLYQSNEDVPASVKNLAMSFGYCIPR